MKNKPFRLKGFCLGLALYLPISSFASALSFQEATRDQKAFLVEFAIDSHDIYKTRKSSREIARDVLAIKEEAFSKGVIQVLKRDKDTVGFFALLEDKGGSFELTHLFVKAGLQGKGLGRRLFQEAIKSASKRGCKNLFWISDPDSKEFYQKMGGEVTGFFPNLLNPGVDVPLFTYAMKKESKR